MANTDQPIGFKLRSPEQHKPIKMLLVDATVVEKGDVVYMASSGLVQLTRVAGYVAGIAAGAMTSGLDKKSVVSEATAANGDFIMVYADADAIFQGQITTFALTAPYVTATSATAFDISGTTGVQEINAGATAQDEVQIISLAPDVTGEMSIVGADAKVNFRFNPAKHVFGDAK